MARPRYLFLRLSALGDVVFALEALQALRVSAPDAVIDWAVEDRARGLLEGHPLIERVIVYPRNDLARLFVRPWAWVRGLFELSGYVRALRRERYDCVLDLHGNLKSGLHLLLSRGRRKLAFAPPRAKELSHLAASELVQLPDGLHRADQGRLMVEQLLGRPVADPGPLIPVRDDAAAAADELIGTHPLIPVRDDAARAAEELLATHPAGARGTIVCLAPGTSVFAAFKRWPADRYRVLAHRLSAAGHRVVLCTGPGEEDLARSVQDGTPVLSLDGGRHGIAVYLEVLRKAAVLVGADSGPLHMAQAVGTRVVALFGPKDPGIYGPRLPGSIVLRYPVPCAPCGRRSCEAPMCILGIPVEEVEAAVREIIHTKP